MGRILSLGFFAICTTVLNTGCLDNIGQAMLDGFGLSLGALPANYIADTYLASLFPDSTVTQ
jgi:hypothetical protein